MVLFVVLLGCFLLVPSISFAAERDTNWFEDGVIWILYWVYVLFSQFVSLAATIFLWVIDSGVFSALMNDTAIYTVWLTVRDFCNIFFILVLLFSAFATIFQLEKYEWKKTLPTLIIMALLVNFSFPISRFVIDLANVPMYFFAQNTVGQNANAIAGEILSASKIQNVILPGVESSSQVKNVPQMFAATICMFLFGISFLVLSLLMLTRMIALAILVMFSPIGFVGMITPALHKFAHDWWDKLFKWAFYGPIAVMLVLVAIVVMQAGANIQSSHAMQNMVGSSSEYEFIKNIAFLAIPIVLFWIAITQAEKYSNDMSGLGIKFGSNMGRKVGGWIRQGAWGATGGAAIGLTKYGWKQSGVPGGVKTWWNERTGLFSSRRAQENRERREASRAGGLLGDRDARMDALERKRVYERVEANKKANKTYKDLKEEVTVGNKVGASASDKIGAKAAALTMADKEMFENATDFENALKAVGGDMDSVSKVIRKAPKEMLQNSDDLVRALSAVDTATAGMGEKMKAQMKKQVIEKADGGTLAKIDETQYGKIRASFGTDAGLLGSFDAKMKKEGKMSAIIKHRIKEESTKKGRSLTDSEIFNEYNELLKGFDASNLGKQGGLMDDTNFRKYFREKGTLGDYDADFLMQYLKSAGGGNREAFKKAVVA